MIKLEEFISGYLPIWVSPNGKLNMATEGHATFAQNELGLPVSDEFEDTERAYKMMYEKGFVRVTAEPDNIFFTYANRRPSRSQIKSIKDLGIENNSVVTDDVSGRVLFSPHFLDEQNEKLENDFEFGD